eukprot:282519_1
MASDEKQMDMKEERQRPTLVLGTMTFGNQVKEADVPPLINEFISRGHVHLDTAYIYTSEPYLSATRPSNKDCVDSISKALISTKLAPNYKVNDVKKGLSYEGIKEQIDISLKRLNVQSIDILYLHWPDSDPTHPIEETLKACNELFKAGKFKRFGLSNFPAWKVADIWHICNKNNYICPQIYQGNYNPLCRQVEKELIPCLRRFNMNFYAYCILCGGILSGKHSFSDKKNVKESRFASDNWIGNSQANWFWKESYFKGIDIIKEAVNKVYGKDINLVEIVIRWMCCHSKLDKKNDGILIGTSKLKYLKKNLDFAENAKPLNDEVVKAFDNAWKISKKEPRNYFF